MLKVAGHAYSVTTTQTKTSKVWWRCSTHQDCGCRAGIITKHDVKVGVLGRHAHETTANSKPSSPLRNQEKYGADSTNVGLATPRLRL